MKKLLEKRSYIKNKDPKFIITMLLRSSSKSLFG